MNRKLKLSDNNKKVTHVMEEVQSYPDDPDRFDHFPQLLCRNDVTGRCYWEVEWRGRGVDISVSYRGINRKADSADCLFGCNDQSWSLRCYVDEGYSVIHSNRVNYKWSDDHEWDDIAMWADSPSSSYVSKRVAVYVDCAAGTLSFYRVSSDTLIHLHTFNTTFTEPLYAGFGVYWPDSSVSLCPL
ncbi:cytolytic toxin-beta-like [Scomber scombrus]|uniref:cytolytic toxin-beta-like n=1 Tax=Scomber scombrus TaxID=13677 RepID=UPI002DDA5F69|nr:cytolytic toxin-beta-like [Scomber scombrus]